ncbi:hypothetical protein HY633_02750 [Candidatus Uhrbacteria bacterium]|nr:hypothetical protein [Candidatus Uhrbacteria bacterium]
MKILLVCRHGDYSSDGGRLTDYGRIQIRNLADNLRTTCSLDGKRILLLTSTAPRAMDSAEVLKACLAIPFLEPWEFLWSDRDHRQNNGKVLSLIKKKADEADVLILMSHLEYCEDIPVEFARQVLNVGIKYIRGPGKASARIVFCENGANQFVE